ncbi:ras association domain-containing protein 7-like [Paramormyrops kingsleyae]|uniref:ras association domain-containing protein 7-like n=1 Tax=Paramormyrops kingsleyae TaxID=1676925 RepID=UPI003B96FED8
MELKVWVDGVVRVVCGLSQETSCQDVVIALAQAIGQTGRYVLIQKLRDTERQLLADERPLELLAKLGQHSKEVQFFLRRTGPSSSEGPGPDRGPTLPKPPEPVTLRRREPKKSLTFNLGPANSPQSRVKQIKKTPRDSPEARASPPLPGPAPSPVPGPGPVPSIGTSKEEVFRLILQQQEKLQALDVQLETVEERVRECDRAPGPGPRQDKLEQLEEQARRNQAELAQEAAWEEELHAEAERERGLRRCLAELHSSLDDCGRRLNDCTAHSAQLEREIQQEAHWEESSLDTVRAELQSQQHQGVELEASLTEAEKTLGRVETLLQAKKEEIDELNKELRQCNLQQFIQQTGVPPTPPNSHTDPLEQMEQAKLQQDGYSNGESLSRPTAKHFLGHPRNLQNPAVSSLNPEVLTSRESSWR